MKRILLTGGPSSGKTSIVAELEKRGLTVCHEKARQVIKEQLSFNSGTSTVPWKDVLSFSKEVVNKILADSFLEVRGNAVFFDRGVPDVLGYLNHAGIRYDRKWFDLACRKMNYSKTAFFFPCWEEIYKNDSERKETFEEALLISKEIKNVYLSLGFNLIEVPKKTIAERIDFILSATGH